MEIASMTDKEWRENEKVRLILDQGMKKFILQHCQLSDRILVGTMKGEPFNISIAVIYAPSA